MAKRAIALRPRPDEHGRLPDQRTRAGMPDLYAYAHELGEYKRRNPGDDVMTNLMREVDDEGGQVSVGEFENLFWLFSVAGNETLRNALPGGMYALMSHVDEYRRLRADRGAAAHGASRRCCAGGRRSCGSAARPPWTPSSAARGSGPATRSWCGSPPPTATSARSPSRTGSTCAGNPTTT